MKVLFLAEEVPVPADTGAKLRTYNLIREAAERHEIVLACACLPGESPERMKAEFEGRVTVELLPLAETTGKSGIGLLKRVTKNLFSSEPVIINSWRCARIGNWITDLVGREKFDVFHCDSIYVCGPLLSGLGIPSVFDAHNVEAMIWERYATTEKNSFVRLFWKWQLGKMVSFEGGLAKWFDAVAAVSEEDRSELVSRYHWKHAFVAVNGVDVGRYSVVPDASSGIMAFVGSLDWRPNQDAVDYMINDILPIVRKISPQSRLRVIGRRPPDWMLKLCQKKDVELIRDAPDIRPHLYEADLTVVPLRIGGGSRLKILESLAAGKAVVSTSVGAEGLDFADSKPVVIANTPEGFAQAACDLLNNRDERMRMGDIGRRFVEQNYSWKRSALELEKAWSEAARQFSEKDQK